MLMTPIRRRSLRIRRRLLSSKICASSYVGLSKEESVWTEEKLEGSWKKKSIYIYEERMAQCVEREKRVARWAMLTNGKNGQKREATHVKQYQEFTLYPPKLSHAKHKRWARKERVIVGCVLRTRRREYKTEDQGNFASSIFPHCSSSSGVSTKGEKN